MNRQTIYSAIEEERDYQDQKWGNAFDHLNTPNDWVAYMTKYLGQAVTMPWDPVKFREQILKTITIGVAVLEQEDYAPRHYDGKQTQTRVENGFEVPRLA